MFKFSKRKPRTDADISVEIKTQSKHDIVEESVPENSVQPVKSEDSEFGSSGQYTKRNREVRRLNSLDSGIVVDKISDQATNGAVEYAVVQKTKPKIKDLIKTKEEVSLQADTEDITKTVLQRSGTENVQSAKEDRKCEHTDVVYINGDKTDEDFVYINERPVDVEGLVEPVKTIVSETLPSLTSAETVNKTEEKQLFDDERQSNASNDSGTSSGSIIRRSDMLTPEKANFKKKSWSFQFGGKKKQSDELESASVVSMDPNASQTVETKKPKWRFGKFSFRKGSDDVSTSTPNLHKAGIPEDGAEVTMRKQSEDKKKTKLKKIKAKKEKKRSSKKIGSSLDQRSTSMIDIGRGEPLAPRSRRSIVEEDLDFTQTDVFEGVSLSDLSQDEEPEVSTNPAGGQIGTKKASSKKGNMTVLNKTIDLVKSTVETKTEKIVKQASLDKTVAIEKSDKTKLTKSDSLEDNSTKATDTLGNTVAELHASLNPENTEDEYVNIVNAKSECTESAIPQDTKIVTEDVEYAQVVKTKVKEIQIDKDKSKQKIQSSVPEKVLKLNTVKVLNAETNEVGKIPAENTNITETLKTGSTKEESKAEESEQMSGETAFSNMIYSDEEFRATLANMVKTKSDHEHEDESDAYVELQQIVEDFSGKKETSQEKVIENTEIKTKSADLDEAEEVKTVKAVGISSVAAEVVTGKTDSNMQSNTDDISGIVNEVDIKKTDSAPQETETVKPAVNEMTEKSVAMPVESLITPDINKTPESTETDIPSVTKVIREGSVIVLKDVGVQVPDIYMPLDKDKDFGFTANNVPCVSIGIQVTDKDLDIEHVVVSINTEESSEKVSPAYF
ncbi:uncharacterized protein LOC123551907 [Mercenaria mercenaria]|uniref:uncharacterized protein LOC123551907 n=1 Tax=Mercenaria mercenaria TaxID=6596 RepID=UPI00234F0946|nr:uncharacterized protein LOC123551907 [Mercenaria mercenaria]XP_045197121.2 uncharacterized protein LOC123551907 [Mercenaria mercenaria]